MAPNRLLPSPVRRTTWAIAAAHRGPHGIGRKSSDLSAILCAPGTTVAAALVVGESGFYWDIAGHIRFCGVSRSSGPVSSRVQRTAMRRRWLYSVLSARCAKQLQPADSSSGRAFNPARRVLNSCRLIRSAVAALVVRTTTPDITSCSLMAPSSKTGQSMDISSFCPGSGGWSVVKLSPELLRSIVRPDPVLTIARRFTTV